MECEYIRDTNTGNIISITDIIHSTIIFASDEFVHFRKNFHTIIHRDPCIEK